MKYESLLTLIATLSGLEVYGIREITEDGSEKLRLHFQAKDRPLSRGYSFYLDELRNKGFKAKNYGIKLTALNIRNLLAAVEEKYESLNALPYTEGLGWNYDKSGNPSLYVGTQIHSMDGSNLPKDSEKGLPESQGDLNKVLTPLKEYLSKNIIRQVIFAFALSAVICGLLDKTLLLSLVADSSVGKTTIAKLCLSAYCSPLFNKLSKTFNATENYLVKCLDKIKGALLLIDDSSLSKSKDYTNLVYELASGIEKGRLGKGNKPCEPSRWATVIMMTAEKSLLFNCDPDHEGVIARLFEIPASGNDLFDSAEQANDMQKLYSENYGVIVPQFVSYLIQHGHAQNIAALYSQEIERVRLGLGTAEPILNRIAENISLVTLTTELAGQALGIPFDTEAIKQYLLNISKGNLEEFRSMQTKTNILNEVYPQLVEYAMTNSPYKKGNFVVIEKKLLSKFLSSIKEQCPIKPIELKRALKSANLLEVNDPTESPFSYNGTIDGHSRRGLAVIVNPTVMEAADNAQ
jgi:Superfamily II helicase and inactivated derivatives